MARVLILEDDWRLAETWAEALQEQDHDVVIAANATEALEKVRADRPDVVISDVYVRDGGALTNDGGIRFAGGLISLKSIEADFRDIILIAVTGAEPISGGFDPLKIMDTLRADAGLRKPFPPQELVETVSMLLEEASLKSSDRRRRP